MMRAEKRKITEVRLVLSEEEARWLRAYVQNPKDVDFDREPEEDARMREVLFATLELQLD